MRACAACGCYCRPMETTCPHCSASLGQPTRAAAALLLGLAVGLNGCPTNAKYGVPDTETAAQAEYGVADTATLDRDDDGWTPAAGDCDDENADIHPEATETPGDGVDSNCDGADDT